MQTAPSTGNGKIAWLFKMAWRDSRRSRRRLLLFMSSIITGIAALVAISGFGENLERSINDQGRSLLGADLMISARQPFDDQTRLFLDSLGGEQSREVAFSSMALFIPGDQTRLVQVRALGGRYPYYGTLETGPRAAVTRFRSGDGVLVDYNLMLQYDLAVGDSVKLGAQTFPVAGELLKAPGQASAGSTIAPRIYLPLSALEATGLIRYGSRANYYRYIKFAADRDLGAVVSEIEPLAREKRLRVTTVEDRRRRFGNAMENVYRFLNLVAFIALLLGGVGVASAIHVYVKQKLSGIAVLRCLGATVAQTFWIYLIQAVAIGLAGSLIGITLGMGLQLFLPGLLADFILVDVDVRFSASAVGRGLLVGVLMTLLFALLPLLRIRRVSPLLAMRSAVDPPGSSFLRDGFRLAVAAAIIVFVVFFAVEQTRSLAQGLAFSGGLALVFLLLGGSGWAVMRLVRGRMPRRLAYVWRQSLANLYRPNNQTLILVLALGLGTFLIATLYMVQDNLLQQVSLSGRGNQPNLVFFDIQSDQKDAVTDLVGSYDLPVRQMVPIVTVKLAAINGRTVTEIRSDSSSAVSGWALNREYRVTYRDTLSETETILAGEWVERMPADADTVAISLENDIAVDLGVGIGDLLDVDVQGITLPARVASLREVDWQKVQPNFFMVFPANVLEAAPQIYVLVTRSPSAEQTAVVQREIVKKFPNISAIDLSLILRTIESLLDKIAFVIRFMALFSILTGLIVLISAIMTTRYQRIQESVLLRTLGARKDQIQQIMVLEYAYLGGLAAFTGFGLALISTWLLSYFLFDTIFAPRLPEILAIPALIVGLTVLLGVFNGRDIAHRPPLEILREAQ